MTLATEIIAAHSGRRNVVPGEIVSVAVDRVYLQDGNVPTVQRLYQKHGFETVFDTERVAAFFDHAVLSPAIEISNRLTEAKHFCSSLGIKLFDHGEGISHLVAVEAGWFQPGNLVVATDSHACTGGVVQSLALGMGASDVVAAMVSGRTWLRVPQTTTIRVTGTPGGATRAKDVALYAMSRFGNKSLLYQSLEWCGEWVENLTNDEASTIANMAVEMGAKCVFLPPRPDGPVGMHTIEPSETTLELSIQGLSPVIAKPNSPFNVHCLDHCAGQAVNYVFVGSCANSRLEDIAEVAKILAGRRVASSTRLIVTPGSRSILLDAIAKGYMETIVASGGIFTPPGCGSCVGTQGHIPADGDVVLSTMNRNFLGRMGNSKAEIWLSSPIIAAYTALKGEIPTSQEIDHDLRVLTSNYDSW